DGRALERDQIGFGPWLPAQVVERQRGNDAAEQQRTFLGEGAAAHVRCLARRSARARVAPHGSVSNMISDPTRGYQARDEPIWTWPCTRFTSSAAASPEARPPGNSPAAASASDCRKCVAAAGPRRLTGRTG